MEETGGKKHSCYWFFWLKRQHHERLLRDYLQGESCNKRNYNSNFFQLHYMWYYIYIHQWATALKPAKNTLGTDRGPLIVCRCLQNTGGGLFMPCEVRGGASALFMAASHPMNIWLACDLGSQKCSGGHVCPNVWCCCVSVLNGVADWCIIFSLKSFKLITKLQCISRVLEIAFYSLQ